MSQIKVIAYSKKSDNDDEFCRITTTLMENVVLYI